MKIKSRVICLTACLLLLSACARTQELSLFAMDTVIEIKTDGSQQTLNEASEAIFRMERAFSAVDPASDLYKLNERGGGEMSGDLAEIIPLADRIARETNGAFDYTLYALSETWGIYGQKGLSVPDETAVQAAKRQIGYKNVIIDANTLTLSNVKLDLGAIAKGYALDQVAGILKRDCHSALIDMGGDIMLIGARADGRDWNVGIRDPRGSGVFAEIRAHDTAVVSSGDYERYFMVDGVRYHHIFDGNTGYPAANGTIAATVVTPDGAVADAYCTALFVMGAPGIAFMQERGIAALAVDENKRVYATDAMKAILTITNEEYKLQ